MNPTPKQVQKLRAQTGLSQNQAAKALGVSRRTIQNWEHGTVKMPQTAWVVLQMQVKK